MTFNKRIIIALVLIAALLPLAVGRSRAQSQTELTQDFQQTYPLAANGRVSLSNINGFVHISTWDRAEVKVQAVKRAYRQDRLDEVQVKIEASADSIRISSDYPHRSLNFDSDADRRTYNPASVDYTLVVPRNARIDSVEAINGSVQLEGLAGDVRASAINGRLTATGLTGDVRISTINGKLEATFAAVSDAKAIALSSVNGSVQVTLPSDVQAQLKADTIHGGISNDFGVPVRNGKYFGHNLSALLGNGGARIKVSNVNGQISIGRASDGRTPSRVTNLLTGDDNADNDVDSGDNDGGDDSASDLVDMQNDLREAQRELEHANRELERSKADLDRAVEESKKAGSNDDAAREAAKEAEDEAREAQRDAEQDRADAEREIKQLEQQIQDLSNRRAAGPTPQEVQRQIDRATRDAQRDVARSVRDAQREGQRAAREAQREVERARPEIERATREAVEGNFNFGGNNLNAIARDTKTFAVTGAPTVNAETFDGTVAVRSTDSSEVTYTVVKRAEDDERLAGIHVTANQSGNVITIKVEFDKSVAHRNGNNYSYNATANLEVSVPRNATVRAASGDGNVRVEGVNGQIDARTGDGSVSVSDGQGKVTATTGDGRISLTNVQGEVEAKTGDGSINVEGQFTKLSASTGDGSISVTIPANSNVTIESNAEQVSGSGITLTPRTDQTRGTRRWDIGAGGPVFSLKTGDGRVTIRQP